MKGLWNDERDPLTALQGGRTDLFEAFVETETSSFLAFFRRLGATPGEAEDLTQDTFLKLYENADKYRATDRFAPFALRVARNAWIDRRRRRSIRGTGQSEDRDGDWDERVEARGEEPLVKLERRDEAQRVEEALATLSDLHRAVFELGVLQEMAYTDIASELDIPVGTVKSRMFYAVRKIRDALNPAENTEVEGGADNSPSKAGFRPGLTGGGAA